MQSALVNMTIVAGTAFCCACAAFTLSVFVLIPICGTLQSVQVPQIIPQSVILFCLFGFPVCAAIVGITLGEGFIQADKADRRQRN